MDDKSIIIHFHQFPEWQVLRCSLKAILASCYVILVQFGGFALITACAPICCSVSFTGNDKTQSTDTKMNSILTVFCQHHILIL